MTAGVESKLAQLLFDGTVGGTGCCCGGGTEAVEGGSGSKSIRELSLLSSVGFPLEDAKLLEDAVLCGCKETEPLVLGGSMTRKGDTLSPRMSLTGLINGGLEIFVSLWLSGDLISSLEGKSGFFANLSSRRQSLTMSVRAGLFLKSWLYSGLRLSSYEFLELVSLLPPGLGRLV